MEQTLNEKVTDQERINFVFMRAISLFIIKLLVGRDL